ncbi:hypothetical protein ACULNC_08770 [Shigella flexneri]
MGNEREALAFDKQLSPQKLNYKLYWCAKKLKPRAERCCCTEKSSWNWWDDVTVEIRFWLPAGSFATSVVRELINTTGDYAHIAE